MVELFERVNFLIFIIIVLIFIFYIFWSNKIIIKFKTFFKKGFRPIRGKFGGYCFDGKQGSGKTYSVVEFLKNNSGLMPIYANIKTLDNDIIDYTYFNGFDNLLNLRDKHDCIIVYDEIFTALTKQSKMNTDVLDFLSQMRKRKIIFLTTAQEWLEINITLRRYCRFRVECSMRNFLGLGILTKRFYDAEHMRWSQQDNEYVAPLLSTTISKCNIDVANSYDTFEQIKT